MRRTRVLAGMVAAALAVGVGAGLAGRDDEAGGTAPAVAMVNPAAVPVAEPVKLADVSWQLVRVTADGRTVLTRPNLDHTLEISADGRYLFSSCNNAFGGALVGTGTLHADGGTNTARECAGAAGFVDAAVHRAVPGDLEWTIAGRRLTLTSPIEGVEMEFRVKDRMRPPTTAAEVATVEAGGVWCRAVVGGKADAERLYVLTRKRINGPWRLLESGPAAPGEGPIRSPQRLKPYQPACVLGFAPEGAATVTYRRSAAEPGVGLPLHKVPGSERRIYAALIVPKPDGMIESHDRAGRTLTRWAALD